MQEFTIGDVMKITGLSRSSILYYEQQGLIHPVQKKDSRYRIYSIEDLTLVMFYQNMKQMEVSVADYAGVITETSPAFFSDVESMLLYKKQEYLQKIEAQLAMVRYWDQALASLRYLRNKPYLCTEHPSAAAWTLRFQGGKAETKSAIAHWDDYFLQRNLAYFFDARKVTNGDYSFERGLSCYADCALVLSPDIRKSLIYKAPQNCLTISIPFDFKTEDFSPVYALIEKEMTERHFVLDGDPWGNFSIRDDNNPVSPNTLFLWVPVAAQQN